MCEACLLSCHRYNPVRFHLFSGSVSLLSHTFSFLLGLTMFCRYCSSIIKLRGAKAVLNWCSFKGLTNPLQHCEACLSVCVWTDRQQCLQMDMWVVQGSSRCLTWPLLLPFIEPLASTQRQGQTQTLNTLACALMPEVTTALCHPNFLNLKDVFWAALDQWPVQSVFLSVICSLW